MSTKHICEQEGCDNEGIACYLYDHETDEETIDESLAAMLQYVENTTQKR